MSKQFVKQLKLLLTHGKANWHTFAMFHY